MKVVARLTDAVQEVDPEVELLLRESHLAGEGMHVADEGFRDLAKPLVFGAPAMAAMTMSVIGALVGDDAGPGRPRLRAARRVERSWRLPAAFAIDCRNRLRMVYCNRLQVVKRVVLRDSEMRRNGAMTLPSVEVQPP